MFAVYYTFEEAAVDLNYVKTGRWGLSVHTSSSDVDPCLPTGVGGVLHRLVAMNNGIWIALNLADVTASCSCNLEGGKGSASRRGVWRG